MRAAFLAFALFLASPAQAVCRIALAIGVDVSASVDAHEYKLQLGGLADALSDADVKKILLLSPETPVDLAGFEWAAKDYQRIILPWTTIGNATTLAQVVALLHRASRGQTGVLSDQVKPGYSRLSVDPSTAIGSAMLFGVDLLSTRTCWARTLDLSGDGISNTGPEPKDVIQRLKGAGVTINALPIMSSGRTISADGKYLATRIERHFLDEVIMGPGAFIKSARGFKDFKAAMTQKLLRELEGPNLSYLMQHP
jgi:hypothetical protein